MRRAPAVPSVEELGRRDRRVASTSMHMSALGLLFAAAGVALSALVDMAMGGPDPLELTLSACVIATVGGLGLRASRIPERVSPAAAFAAASTTWIVVSVAGALPFLAAGTFELWEDALFESVSGFTATGSTVLSPIEGNGPGILFWRQLTQWYGGMGMIVLAVAVLPFLGVGGLELLNAEAPGPTSDKLAPRVSDTAKRLWGVYLVLTAALVVALLLAGLDLYDAAAHAFTGVATGGYSPYDKSIAHFDSVIVEVILQIGMFGGATSFILLWQLGRDGPRSLLRSSEFRFYVAVVLVAVGTVWMLNAGDGTPWARALRDSSFSVVSIVTTTGFATADYGQWPDAAQLVLLALMLTGGMSGSTSGAIKLLRVQILARFTRRELLRARQPRRVMPIVLGDRVIPEGTASRAVGFVLLYFVVFVASTAALGALGSDLETAVGGVATTMGGVGPGLGDAGPVDNFLGFSRPARAVLMADMILGRLEIFPVLLMAIGIQRSITRGLRRVRSEVPAPIQSAAMIRRRGRS